MVELSRRKALIGGLATLFCAPAIIRTPGLLMPVKAEPVFPFGSRWIILNRQNLEKSAYQINMDVFTDTFNELVRQTLSRGQCTTKIEWSEINSRVEWKVSENEI